MSLSSRENFKENDSSRNYRGPNASIFSAESLFNNFASKTMDNRNIKQRTSNIGETLAKCIPNNGNLSCCSQNARPTRKVDLNETKTVSNFSNSIVPTIILA